MSASAAAVSAPAGAAAARAALDRTAMVTTHGVSVAQQQAARAYWTAPRRASAASADARTATAPAVRSPRIVHAGQPARVAGGLPSGRNGWAAAGPALAGPTPARAGGGLGYPFTSFGVPVNDYTENPFMLNGTIFFTNNNVNYLCSGTSVASYHGGIEEDEVWTAGHCVANTNLNSPGLFDSSAEFVPAYNGDSADPEPFGVFPAIRYSVATAFLLNADLSVDEGAMEVGTNSAGQTLGQAVGYSGFAWNYPSSENFVTFGYPAESPYDGHPMIEDIAPTATLYTSPGGEGQPLIGIGSPMTGGSSGGAWYIDWSTSSSGYIDGHNDLTISNQLDAMFSPYQDTLSNQVRCFGAASC